MLFEDNLAFLVLKILIIFAGTIAMMASTVNFKIIQRKAACMAVILGYAVFVVLSTFLIIYYFSYEHFLRVFILTISLPAVLLLRKISDEQFAKLVFTGATQILVSLYISATVTLINTALHGNELSDILLRLLCYLLAVLLDFRFVRHIWLDSVSMIKKGWGVLSLIPCAFIILAVTVALYPEHYAKRPLSAVTLYLLGAVIVAVYFSIGSYLSMQYRRVQSEQNREILELQLENIRRENADIEALEKQTKIIRHDLRHILSTVAALAESGDMQAVLDFAANTAELSEDIPKPRRYCSDPILDATLSGYLASAREADIELETSVSLPDVLPVDSSELSVCFANMLESAIRACMTLAEDERRMSVRCIHSPKLMFEVACPYHGKLSFDKKGLPKPPDGGFGSSFRSIASFCERHDAIYSFTADNGRLRIMVAL